MSSNTRIDHLKWVKDTTCIHQGDGRGRCTNPIAVDKPHGWLCSQHEMMSRKVQKEVKDEPV